MEEDTEHNGLFEVKKRQRESERKGERGIEKR